VTVEQDGIGCEKFQHFDEAVGAEPVVAADARALFEVDVGREAVGGEK